jgi:hypothetical protein
MTRLTSRAWKRNATRPSASFATLFPGPSVQFPERPLVAFQPLRHAELARLVELGRVGGDEVLPLFVAEVGLGGAQRPPVGLGLETFVGDRNQVVGDSVTVGRAQEHLDDHLALLVAALTEVHVPDRPFRVRDVHAGPVVVREGAPDRVLGVERDRILDALVRSGPADVVGVSLERELRRVDADNDQALIPVLLVPRADVAERAQPVDARVRPEVDEHDLPLQALRSQRFGVEPAGRAVEPGQMRLGAQLRE